jgi:hypothetical protein
MTIHLDWGEAEFWQQYESVNESVIATARAEIGRSIAGAVSRSIEPECDCFASSRLRSAPDGEREERDNSCGPTDFGS